MLETLSKYIPFFQYEENTLRITKEVVRSDYVRLKEVFGRVGLVSVKGDAHQFDCDPKRQIEAILKSGVVPENNPLDFFPTPKSLIDNMLCMADVCEYKPLRILEPSAGVGGIMDVLYSTLYEYPHQIDCVELNPKNIDVLKSKGYQPNECSFLDFQADYKYDYIFMNPPFNIAGNRMAYIDHVKHAYSMLDDMGTLIAIVPVSFLKNKAKKEVGFLDLTLLHGEVVENPSNSFAESGTNVETATIVLHGGESPKLRTYCGYQSVASWAFCVTVANHCGLSEEYNVLIGSKRLDDKTVGKFVTKSLAVLKSEKVYHPLCLADQYVSDLMRIWAIDNDGSASKVIQGQMIAEQLPLCI